MSWFPLSLKWEIVATHLYRIWFFSFFSPRDSFPFSFPSLPDPFTRVTQRGGVKEGQSAVCDVECHVASLLLFLLFCCVT